MFSRLLSLDPRVSCIVIGPRQCGKTTWMRHRLESLPHWSVDLLKVQTFLKYSKSPELFREEALFQIKKKGLKLIWIDEIQKLPFLLDEVHSLIESEKCVFWLSGSSARKLKRQGVNLLAGRAILKRLFPLTYPEIRNLFTLEKILQFGSLPSGFQKTEALQIQTLKTYTELYLKEEIQAEGLVRNLGGFSRFLEVAAQSMAEVVNYTKIGRDCNLPARSVQGYFEILEDTLIGFCLPPWSESIRKQLSTHPKFYFFDGGVACALLSRLRDPLDPTLRGHLFEQWILGEVRARIEYSGSELKPHFWRTLDGKEVDILLAHGKIPKLAIECKSHKQISDGDLESLLLLKKEYPKIKSCIVCTVTEPRTQSGVDILPWRYFLEEWLPDFVP